MFFQHTARVAQDFPYVIFRLFHGQLAPLICPPVEHVWGSAKTAHAIVSLSVYDLELASLKICAPHLPQDNIRCLINSMPDRVAACIAARGVSTRAIEVAQYLCRCTPCVRLIVLLFKMK
ncbi:hypothetical protein TNCV_4094591 [Trichonephila clavipes]|nr:hypothetical protein TNCV_4094591 [Trichonephila clavipes]